ncbi:MAG: adenylosuccinate synthetase, partial [Synergistaceae bacterium]|nr:adenylosuccinate synthetase [Synergistaceae bacterium]
VDAGQHILLEGAQAALLDIDHGTYPYVTSSSTSAAGAFTGTGLAPSDLTRVIAVVKAYTTRVGEGPFPTEDFEEAGETLRKNGGEYGATTGRPRRCGWLDMVALKYSMELNGASVIALTKLDVLTGMGGIKVCTAYELDGEKISSWPTDTGTLDSLKPVYEVLPGWNEDITNCKTFDELPANAQAYVKYIEQSLNTPVFLIGVGADRTQTIVR